MCQGVSPVCAVFPLQLCFGCSVLQVSCLQSSFACCGQCFVPSLNVASFNKMYSGVLVKWDLIPLPQELRPCIVLVYGMSRGLCLSSGKGDHGARTEAIFTEKSNPARAQEVGLDISKLGNQCWSCAGSHRWLCVLQLNNFWMYCILNIILDKHFRAC